MSATPIVQSSSTAALTDLLTWKDPIQTGKIFGSIIAGLVIFKSVNLLNIFFHLSYIALLFSAAGEYAGKLVTGQGFVTKYKPTSKTYAKTIKDTVLPSLGRGIENLEDEFQKIVYSHDIETTLKAAGLSYIFYKVTSWFSFFTLLTTSVVLLFTVPVIYVKNKKEIDAAVAQYSKLARDKTAEITKLAQDKAAPHVKTLVDKSGPVGSFLQSKFPTRTAGSTVSDKGVDFTAPHSTSTPAPTSTSTKFPEIPTDSIKDDSTFEDLVEEAKGAAHATGTSVHAQF